MAAGESLDVYGPPSPWAAFLPGFEPYFEKKTGYWTQERVEEILSTISDVEAGVVGEAYIATDQDDRPMHINPTNVSSSREYIIEEFVDIYPGLSQRQSRERNDN